LRIAPTRSHRALSPNTRHRAPVGPASRSRVVVIDSRLPVARDRTFPARAAPIAHAKFILTLVRIFARPRHVSTPRARVIHLDSRRDCALSRDRARVRARALSPRPSRPRRSRAGSIAIPRVRSFVRSRARSFARSCARARSRSRRAMPCRRGAKYLAATFSAFSHAQTVRRVDHDFFDFSRSRARVRSIDRFVGDLATARASIARARRTSRGGSTFARASIATTRGRPRDRAPSSAHTPTTATTRADERASDARRRRRRWRRSRR